MLEIYTTNKIQYYFMKSDGRQMKIFVLATVTCIVAHAVNINIKISEL